MAKKAKVQIELEQGQQVLSPFSQLVISQRMDWHHSFELRMPLRAFTGEGGSFADTSEKVIGQPLKIALTATASGESDDNFFKGIITEVNLSRYHGATSDVIIRGFSPTILLEDGNCTRSFEEKSLKDIVNELINIYPNNLLESKVDPLFVDTIPYLVQYKETNYHFLCRMANRYGEWFFYDGSELHFAKPSSSAQVDMVLGNDLINYDLGLKLAPINFKFKTQNYTEDKVFDGEASSTNVSGLNAYGDFIKKTSENLFSESHLTMVRSPLKDKQALDKYIERERNTRSSEIVKMTGVSDNIGVKIGAVLNISASIGDIKKQGTKDEHQKYLITAVSHRIDGDGNYQNQFEAIPSTLEIPPKNPHVSLPVSKSQTAIVKENSDPDKMGRVRVQFYWQEGSVMTPWVRVLMGHAGGADHGIFFMPEIGDEVMVDFEYGDPDRPLVSGMIYHGKKLIADDWNNGENDIKAIKTKCGNEIRFTDTSGTETIKIFNPDSKNEITMTLSDSGSITIKSQGKINIHADGAMAISADEISMNANKKITVGCQELEVSSKQNTSFSAGQEYSLSSGTKMAISSGTDYELNAGTNMKVSASMDMEANAGMNAKTQAGMNLDQQAGAQVNIQGGAMVNVMAPMVKLN